MSVTIGSLFSGIGGLELGLERAGLGLVIWQAESDPFARKVLAKHWPGVRIYEDVREVDERAERPDIICGGFPCQDISVAGKGAGLAGARSGLWSEFLRIVGILRPRFVVVENVAALVRRGLVRVLGDLSALGYDAEWAVVPASAFGAPHERARLLILAYPCGEGLPPRWQVPLGTKPIQPLPSCGGSDGFPACREHVQREWESRRLVEPPLGGSVDGVPARLVRSLNRGAIRTLGNAVVPQVAEWIGRRIVESRTPSPEKAEPQAEQER